MSSLYRSILVLVLAPCLFLASCTRPPMPPVPSAALQEAFKGPLCTRLDGVEWPCSDTDGHLWKQWYDQQANYRSNQAIHANNVENFRSFVLGSLSGLGGSGPRHYHPHGTITTHCTYGSTSSSCTTRY